MIAIKLVENNVIKSNENFLVNSNKTMYNIVLCTNTLTYILYIVNLHTEE